MTALLMVATVTLAACGSSSRGLGSNEADADRDPASDPPVEVRGVDSCETLAAMATAGSPIVADDGLDPLSLACLQPGPAVDLSQMRGKFVVINLWATWCGPCREEMPILQEASERFGDDVQFVGVLTKDSVSSAAGYLPTVGTTYPQVIDPDADLLKSLRVPGLPVSVILDPTGAKVEQKIGAFETADLDALLTDLVAEPADS